MIIQTIAVFIPGRKDIHLLAAALQQKLFNRCNTHNWKRRPNEDMIALDSDSLPFL